MIFGLTHNTGFQSSGFREFRTALCPCGVGSLVQAGHEVYVEAGLGEEGSGFQDEEFVKEGAKVLHSFEEVVRRSQVILRVAPPGERLLNLLEPDQVVISLLQYGLDEKELAQEVARTGAAALAMELFTSPSGACPVFTLISEIAGAMLPHIAAWYLQAKEGGRGILLAGMTGQPPADVAIIGAGTLGLRATEGFLGAGAQVDLLDFDLDRLREAERLLHYRVNTIQSSPLTLKRVARYADVLVCAANLLKSPAMPIVTREMVQAMKPGSVIIDASIDQGGGVATSRVTSHQDPVFQAYGVTHYCVPNISATVPRTASRALCTALTPFLQAIGSDEDLSALERNESIRRALYAWKGQVLHDRLIPFSGKGKL